MVERSLRNVFGKPLYLLMDSLCTNYIDTKSYHPIVVIHTTIGDVERALRDTTASGTAEKEQLAGLRKRVGTTLQVIENLLLATMEEQDVAEMRRRRFFLYQTLALS
jgi:hypothetical protein